MTTFVIGRKYKVIGPLLPVYHHLPGIHHLSISTCLTAHYIELLPNDVMTSEHAAAFRYLWSPLCGLSSPSMDGMSLRERILGWHYIKRLDIPLGSMLVEEWFTHLLTGISLTIIYPKHILDTLTDIAASLSMYNTPQYHHPNKSMTITPFDVAYLKVMSVSRGPIVPWQERSPLDTPPSIWPFTRPDAPFGDNRAIIIVSHPTLALPLIVKDSNATQVLVSPTERNTLVKDEAVRKKMYGVVFLRAVNVPGVDIYQYGNHMSGMSIDDGCKGYVIGDLYNIPSNTIVDLTVVSTIDQHDLSVSYDALRMRSRQRYIGNIDRKVSTPTMDDSVNKYVAGMSSDPTTDGKWSVGRNEYKLPYYLNVMASRSPYINNAISSGDTSVTDIHPLADTVIATDEVYPLAFVWSYLNGYNNGMVQSLGKGDFRIWHYINYFGIPFTSMFVQRYLFRLFHLASSMRGMLDIYQALMDIITAIPISAKRLMVLFEGHITPGYPSSIVDWTLNRLSLAIAPSKPIGCYTHPYISFKPVLMAGYSDDDDRISVLMIRSLPPTENGAFPHNNLAPYYFRFNPGDGLESSSSVDAPEHDNIWASGITNITIIGSNFDGVDGWDIGHLRGGENSSRRIVMRPGESGMYDASNVVLYRDDVK